MKSIIYDKTCNLYKYIPLRLKEIDIKSIEVAKELQCSNEQVLKLLIRNLVEENRKLKEKLDDVEIRTNIEICGLVHCKICAIVLHINCKNNIPRPCFCGKSPHCGECNDSIDCVVCKKKFKTSCRNENKCRDCERKDFYEVVSSDY